MESSNLIKNDFSLKKVNYSLNPRQEIVFNQTEDNESFIISGKKILSFNYKTGFVSEKHSIGKSPLKKLLSLNNLIYVVNVSNDLIEYDINKREITGTLKMEENIISFVYSKFLSSLILLTKDNKLIRVTVEEKLKLTEVVSDYFDFDKKFYSNFFQIDFEGKTVILSHKNILIMHDLVSKETRTIKHQKILTCGVFSAKDNGKVAIGDSSGKIYFAFFKGSEVLSATRHWHAHKVHSLAVDRDNEYLFSCGEEGVVVIWNLNNEEKTFLPRFNSEIYTLSISDDGKTLAVNCKDGSVKFIDLFNYAIQGEFNAIGLHKDRSAENIKKIRVKGENHLLIFDPTSGKIQVVSTTTGKISNMNLLNKNFSSKTESENINYKKLTVLEVINNEYLITSEQIKDDFLLITNLKLYRLNSKNGFSAELLCVADNPHLNESITRISINSDETFISIAETNFKIWKIGAGGNFKCTFVGNYKNTKMDNAIQISEDEVFSVSSLCESTECYSLWNLRNKTISEIFLSEKREAHSEFLNLGNLILLYNLNEFILFSLSDFDIVAKETFTEHIIRKISTEEEAIWMFLQSTTSEEKHLLFKIRISGKEGSVYEVESCHNISKKNLIYLDLIKHFKSILLINTTYDIFVTSKNSILGKKTKSKQPIHHAHDGLLYNKNKRMSIFSSQQDYENEADQMTVEDESDIFEASLTKIK